MTRRKGPIPRDQDPGGRPTLGGRSAETLRVSHALGAVIDDRTAQAVADGMPETQARSRTLRRMLAEGAAAVAQSGSLPVDVEPAERHVTFATDTATDALIGDMSAGRSRSDVIRGLLVASADYVGPPIEPVRTWQDVYEAAIDGATAVQAAALRARIERPEATEREIATTLGVTVAAYKSRVQRAVKRSG